MNGVDDDPAFDGGLASVRVRDGSLRERLVASNEDCFITARLFRPIQTLDGFRNDLTAVLVATGGGQPEERFRKLVQIVGEGHDLA